MGFSHVLVWGLNVVFHLDLDQTKRTLGNETEEHELFFSLLNLERKLNFEK